MRWHEIVVGILDPDEVAPHFLGPWQDRRSARVASRCATCCTRRSPYCGGRLLEASTGGAEAEIERAFGAVLGCLQRLRRRRLDDALVRDRDRYNEHQWDAFPTLKQGFKLILMDEGRHITFGTGGVQDADRKDASYEALVHEIFDAYRGNVVGLVEYQKAVPGLDSPSTKTMKVRHYRNRCREMGITPDETWSDQILDPTIDFVVGASEAG